jgi:DNA topoisomerase-1
VGKHPETGDPIMAGIGRFGPYVQHQKTYASIEAGDDVLNIGLNRAVTLIAEKALKGGRGRRGAADPGRPLGDHPQKGGAVVVKNGRYGAYVSHDGVNATLPRDKAPDAITLEEALALIDERIAKGGGKSSKRPARKAAPAKRAKPAKAPKAKPTKAAKASPASTPKKAKPKKSASPPRKVAAN